MVYGLKIVELLEKDGIKTNSYVERLINEILDENLDVLNPPFIFVSSSIDSIYKKVKEKLGLE